MSSYKIIQSGHIIEIYKYQASVGGSHNDVFGGGDSSKEKEEQEDRGDRAQEYKATVNQRARNKIRRLINANFDEQGKFLTLTFDTQVTDVAYANKCFQDFMKRMKRRQKDFKHVTVIEFMKSGRIHYHMITNYEVEPWKNLDELHQREIDLKAIWTHGWCDIGYKETDNIGAYLIKYMTKDNSDERLAGKKRYFFSRNLIQPRELTGIEAKEIKEEYENMPPVFTNEYYSDFHGQVQYSEYNPKRYDLDKFRENIREQEEYCVNVAVGMFGADFVEVEE